MKKNLLSWIIALSLVIVCICLLPTQANAASTSDLTFELNSDSRSYSVTDCKTSASGSLTIPSKYNNKPVTNIEDYAFNGCSNLTSVIIPDSVTIIGSDAFNDCRSLVSITIGNGVTGIEQYTFYNCYSLTSVIIPNSVSYIMDCAFYNCFALADITISDNVTYIGQYAFKCCYDLTSIIIPSGVTYVGPSAFESCTGLTSAIYCGTQAQWNAINIGNKNTSLTEALQFHDYQNGVCTICGYSPWEYTISNNEVTITGYTGREIELSIPSRIEGLPVTSIGAEAFKNDTALTSITIPDSVTSIGDYAFSGCRGLNEVRIGNNLTRIGRGAFDGCDMLTDIYYCGTETQWEAINIGDMNASFTEATLHFHDYWSGICGICGEKAVYTVTFKNWNGSVISEKTYHWGDAVTVPANPMKPADRTYRYVFAGWDQTVTTVDGNKTYTAVFDSVYMEYVVVFEDGNNTISAKLYHYGDRIEIPADPTRAADNTYTYTFAGWEYDVYPICYGDATYKATYTRTHIEYTVAFKNWNGDMISEKTYHWDDEIIVPANPTKVADRAYNYTFAGWDKEVVNCAGNTIYTATYTPTPIEYTVVFKNWNGNVISEKTYHRGDTVTVPANPTKPADRTYRYVFAGWGQEVTTVDGDKTYTAVFDSVYMEYVVVFEDWNNTISAKLYHIGEVIEIPDDPVREADNAYTYTFTGWNQEVYPICGGDATYKATYMATPIDYTVVFKNWNGDVISTNTYHWGDEITVPANPTKAADDTYTYTFSGWGSDVAENCAGNATYTATFTATCLYSYSIALNQVMITGYTGSEANVTIPGTIEGLPVTCIGDRAFYHCTTLTSVIIPDSVTRIGQSAFEACFNLRDVSLGKNVLIIDSYAFVACSLSQLAIPESVTVIGKFVFYECHGLQRVNIPNGVTYIGEYTFFNCGLTDVVIGNSVINIGESAFESCDYLTRIVIPDSVTRIGERAFEGCADLTSVIFCGTQEQWACISIITDREVLETGLQFHNAQNGVCTVCKEKLLYTVTFKNWNNVVLSSDEYYWGDAIVVPANPTRVANNACTYTFAGWDQDVVANCAGNATYKAIYTSTPIEYTVVFKNWNGDVISTGIYQWNDKITIPANPTKVADSANTYTFAGWDQDVVANCAGDATYTATYISTPIEYTVVFKNWNGDVISKKTYHWNDAITIPANPTKVADEIYAYTFAGWDQDVAVNCAGDATYIATYTATPIEYTVVFKNWNDDVISEKTYHWNDEITIPANPTKVADNANTYTFAGWDKDVAENCAGDATYIATYTATPIEYTVVFKNWDGDVISEETYHWDDEITIPANPTRPNDSTYTYTFAGWDKPVVNCAGNTIYTAKYTSAYIDYTVTFKNWDGSVLDSNQYHYNDIVTPPSATPTKPEDSTYKYVFKGWDSEIMKVIGNKIYTAVYDAIKKIMEITSNVFHIQGDSIGKVGIGTSASSFVSKLDQAGSVKIYKGNTQVSGNTAIGTGMEVKLMDGNAVVKSYTVVVTGDTNGDGAISVTDMIAIKAHVLKKTLLTGAYAEAADTSNDNAISITDFIQVKAQILGKSSIVPN